MLRGDSFTFHTLSVKVLLDVPVRFYQFPGFVFHGVLGRKLRQFSCALKKESCEGCPLLMHCAYAYFFISPRPITEGVLPGRYQMPHPWIIRLGCDYDGQPQTKVLHMKLVLFGDAVQSAHVLLLALKEAGKDGILESRIPFHVQEVQLNGEDWDGDPAKLKELAVKEKMWSFKTEDEETVEACRISLVSPLRLKVKGKYASQFQGADLLRNARERLFALCRLYGKSGEGDAVQIDFSKAQIICQELKWLDYSRWSGRQKTTMKLGGVVGEIEMKGLSEPSLVSLMKGAEIAGLGKSTSFGLGEVKIDLMKNEL